MSQLKQKEVTSKSDMLFQFPQTAGDNNSWHCIKPSEEQIWFTCFMKFEVKHNNLIEQMLLPSFTLQSNCTMLLGIINWKAKIQKSKNIVINDTMKS